MSNRIRHTHARFYRTTVGILLTSIVAACGSTGKIPLSGADTVVITVMGTNDVHGELLPQPNRGGLVSISGYVAALREIRANDGGGVLLVDAGDMWQGTLESNLSEGAFIVEAYNALGYDAAAIGNHEFDFGPAGELVIPESAADDPRGALKLRAMEAQFPFLAANLIDTATNQAVAWPNVRPSVMTDVAGTKIGIVGVLAARALQTIISANASGLRMAPLAEAITREARLLRANGAELVIVTAHAGGRCEKFGDPYDLSSCNPDHEIMRVARQLPAGLVDHIIAGHVHEGIAHIVNGISITSSYSKTRAFSRVDFVLDRETRKVRSRIVYPPQPACGFIDRKTRKCIWTDDGSGWVISARYEGKRITPTEAIVAIASRAEAQTRERKMQPLGIFLDTPITLEGRHRSALGHLITDAMLGGGDADVSIHNVTGGIRANLPQGPLTFGSLFNALPFDNRLVVLEISGAELRQVIAEQALDHGRRVGISGMHVDVNCTAGRMNVEMRLAEGRTIQDGDSIKVVVADFLALGGGNILATITPNGGFPIPRDSRSMRDVIGEWLSTRGGSINAGHFSDHLRPRWNLPDPFPATCSF